MLQGMGMNVGICVQDGECGTVRGTVEKCQRGGEEQAQDLVEQVADELNGGELPDGDGGLLGRDARENRRYAGGAEAGGGDQGGGQSGGHGSGEGQEGSVGGGELPEEDGAGGTRGHGHGGGDLQSPSIGEHVVRGGDQGVQGVQEEAGGRGEEGQEA